jgi:hypothetical protein
MVIFGWILFVLLIIADWVFFMLWYTCPAGSDMGGHGVDDIGGMDHWRIFMKYIKLLGIWGKKRTKVLTTGQFPEGKFGIVIIVSVIIAIISGFIGGIQALIAATNT